MQQRVVNACLLHLDLQVGCRVHFLTAGLQRFTFCVAVFTMPRQSTSRSLSILPGCRGYPSRLGSEVPPAGRRACRWSRLSNSLQARPLGGSGVPACRGVMCGTADAAAVSRQRCAGSGGGAPGGRRLQSGRQLPHSLARQQQRIATTQPSAQQQRRSRQALARTGDDLRAPGDASGCCSANEQAGATACGRKGPALGPAGEQVASVSS